MTIAPVPTGVGASICASKFFSLPFRYYVMLMSFISSILMYASRCVVNFAILAMVNDSYNDDLEYKIESNNQTDYLYKIKPAKFIWNQHQQSQIIGAYYYSYTAGQLFSGYFADKLDVINIISLAHLLSSIMLLLSPLAAEKHIILFILNRFIMGFVHTPMSSAFYILFERWFPAIEKSLAQSLLVVGSNLGIAIVLPYTAWLSRINLLGGWPAAFYFLGIATFVFSIVLYLTISSSPEQSRFCEEKERKYLSSVIIVNRKIGKQIDVNWSNLLTSPILWSLTIARGVGGLAYHFVNSKIPTFLENALHYNLQNNGLINATLYIIQGIIQLISGPLSKYIIMHKIMSTTNTRKVFESITLLGPGICFLVMPLLQDSTRIVISCLILSMMFMGAQTGGDLPIIPEMAPQIIGTVYGFSNTIACACGFFSPTLTAFILADKPSSILRWNVMFYAFGSLQIVGFLLFIIFVSSKPQNWTKCAEEKVNLDV